MKDGKSKVPITRPKFQFDSEVCWDWFRVPPSKVWGRGEGLDEGLKVEGGFTFGRLQGGFKRFKGASMGLQGGFKGAQGLQRGLKGASRSLEGGFTGAPSCSTA